MSNVNPLNQAEDNGQVVAKEGLVGFLGTPSPVDVFSCILTHVAEEASEFIWGACKVQRYGFDGIIPQSGESTRAKMIQELAELTACLEILNEELVGAGMEPVVASAAQVQEAKVQRLAILQMEHGLGRFYTGAEGKE